MRALLTNAHIRLLRAMRGAIENDPWFSPWLDTPFSDDGPSLVIEDFSSEPWASLTYQGTRHTIDIRLSGGHQEVETGYDRLKALLTEPEFYLPGHFLAEIALVEANGEIGQDDSMRMHLRYEALTIEE